MWGGGGGVRGVLILHFAFVLIFIESCSGYTQAETVSLKEMWKKNTETDREKNDHFSAQSDCWWKLNVAFSDSDFRKAVQKFDSLGL